MTKIRLSFYTNIPTPYQQDFFKALSVYFELTVIYYAKSESDRQWNISNENRPYQVHYLSDTLVAKWIQKRIKDYHFSWSIIRQLITDRSDYIIISGAYWIPNTVLGLFILRIRGKRLAFFGERLSSSTSNFKNALKRFFLLPIKWNCQRLIVGGNEAVTTYHYYGINFPSSVIPYNIDISRFDKQNLDRAKISKLSETYKSSGQPILLSSGSLISRKNMNVLIKSIKNSHISVHLLIIGEGQDRKNLEQLIENDPRIKLIGFVQAEDLPYYYNLADVFVFASKYDGWGVVINEAIAAGLPVICSDQVGAAREWIIDGVNGFICPANGVTEFQLAIESLINYPDLIKKQSRYNLDFRNKTSSDYYAKMLSDVVTYDLNV
ncbi:glycosyltransferase family 4 protein [Larkinella rosea]|uniref:Glycosyltransferase n=1 Tax=Larkinella rosea TaxID=2025312 RepID=A0A3P1BIF5_9BACT|nr:glycosyltransferase family 4 protein [Larkinella rosea]RRB00879.1 glycosyltransferase [Larkinella rosea]